MKISKKKKNPIGDTTYETCLNGKCHYSLCLAKDKKYLIGNIFHK